MEGTCLFLLPLSLFFILSACLTLCHILLFCVCVCFCLSHLSCPSEHENHARELVRKADLTQWDALVIMSGDGLLFEVRSVSVSW